MIEHPLYTWVDVQSALDGSIPAWPPSLYSVRAYWDGMVVEHAVGEGDACHAWLASQFGPRWLASEASFAIRLESRPEGPVRVLPLTFEPVPGEAPLGVARRSFRQPDTAMRRDPVPDENAALAPKVLAWHSFKGGVGRTTTAVQFGRLLAAQPGTSVMLIDMDFEAPGITWMTAASRLPAPSICMGDVLALVHATPPAEHTEMVALIVERLRPSLVEGLVILPALRASQRDADIRPEHLELGGAGSLADVLARVGSELGVTHVICDLRAGRSELAASLLLDRRVGRVLVTSCGGQSVKGAVQMLEDLAEAFPVDTSDPPITVLISKVESPSQFDDARENLSAAAEEIMTRAPEGRPFPVRFTAALLNPSLLTLPLDWVEVVARLDGYPFIDVPGVAMDMSITQWVASEAPNGGLVTLGVETPATSAPANPAPTATVRTEAPPVDERRRRLEAFTRPMILGEGVGPGPLLPTEFLKNLALANRYRLPVTIVVGEKGAGKTFTYMRLVTHRTWRAFASAILTEEDVSADGVVTPVVWPGSLQDEAKRAIDDRLGGPDEADRQHGVLTASLRAAKARDDEHFDWRAWWLERFARAAGLDSVEGFATAPTAGAPPLFIVDGLEELFAGERMDPAEKACVRALLQEVPTWIRGAGWQVGLLVFVRSDYVRAAIVQNTEQFLAQYRPYELWWDHREARQLVRWAAVQSGAIEAQEQGAALDLRPIWGATTGPGVSPAAPMDAWVMDAMSPDRRSEAALKARDVVRLLAEAARLSVGRGEADRVLAWSAVLEALDGVGAAKIAEIRQLQLDPRLSDALERVRSLGQSMTAPFRYHELEDERDRLALLRLEDEGIAWRERGEVWLLPLYRRGLGLRQAPRRRERVLR